MGDPFLKHDRYLRDRLKEIDENEEIEVTSWEAGFIENIVYKYEGRLSYNTRKAAEKIVAKYLDGEEPGAQNNGTGEEAGNPLVS